MGLVVKWQAQPKQALALVRTEDEILYGGARGGGKTDAGIVWFLYDTHHPLLRGLVIRRNAQDLSDWLSRAKVLYADTGAIFVGNEIRFPSGAVIKTGHLKDENAYAKYQGHQYQKMLIEELNHIPRESDYEMLLGSCRSNTPDIKPQVFCTTNPDGPGAGWVKKRFGIPNEPTGIVETVRDVTALDGTIKHRRLVFIPARLEDNPELMASDPSYETYLDSLTDPELRRAWREGSWAGFNIKGAYYADQMALMRKENRITSVPWESRLPVYTFWDLGMDDSMSIGFFQYLGRDIRWIDYYEANGEGLVHYAKMLQEKPYAYGAHYAPHDIEVRELGTGVSRKETAATLGINFLVVPNLPVVDGIDAVRGILHRVWADSVKCEKGIEHLSKYRKEFNDKLGVFKNTPVHDAASHCSDMFRYMAVTPVLVEGNYKTTYKTTSK